jgi:hypothetical protein
MVTSQPLSYDVLAHRERAKDASAGESRLRKGPGYTRSLPVIRLQGAVTVYKSSSSTPGLISTAIVLGIMYRRSEIDGFRDR